MIHENPLWYKEAIIYQLHIKSFFDANNDGIGDFIGATLKLDYLKSLGINTVWILPFYPSPLKDDGYDIADYKTVNPIYGTLDDFKKFLHKAHELGIRVITELVMNHTSDQHEWFKKARNAPEGSKERNFYVWSDTVKKYEGARIIFQDFEHSNWTWDPIAKSYFWHRFYSHQPDLNFENPNVHKAMFDIVDFWFKLGVDGLRLDAIPYLYEEEDTNCENLPQTHDFLKKLRQHVDENFKDKMLLAEANQWAEDAVAYFGDDNECHMCFHFPLMPRLYMSIEREDRFPILDIIGQTPKIPEKSQWAIFLRNHDELTLEMVTDEERDFMYRAYAKNNQARINLGIRRRLAPLLQNDRKRIQLLNALLLSLPGSPVLYYGDEIGMGDNIFLGDRNGVRTPMQWNSDKNGGFSKANPQMLFLPTIIDPEYHYETINVETQNENKSSLLWWTRKIITIRQKSQALSSGDFIPLHTSNRKVLSFTRSSQEENVLVIMNLSKTVQYVEVDLHEYFGHELIDMFGKQTFPIKQGDKTPFTIGGHDFYWFKFFKQQEKVVHNFIPFSMTFNSNKLNDLDSKSQTMLQDQKWELFLKHCNWFEEDIYDIEQLKVSIVPMLGHKSQYSSLLFEVTFANETQSTYSLPIALTQTNTAFDINYKYPNTYIANILIDNTNTLALVDAFSIPQFRVDLFNKFLKLKSNIENSDSILSAENRTAKLKPLEEESTTEFIRDKNTVIVINSQYVIKFYHRIENGVHPEEEMQILFRDSKMNLPVPDYIGSIHFNYQKYKAMMASVQRYVSNKRDMQNLTNDEIMRYFDEFHTSNIVTSKNSIDNLTDFHDTGYLELIKKCAHSIASIHHFSSTLSSAEPANELYRRSLYQALHEHISDTISYLSERSDTDSAILTQMENDLKKLYPKLFSTLKEKIQIPRIRDHGDLQLDQFLFTGRDIFVLDFEGAHGKHLSTRRIKRLPYYDLASICCSLIKTSHEIMLKSELSIDPILQNKAKIEWLSKVISTFIEEYKNAYGFEINDTLLKFFIIERSLRKSLRENKFAPYLEYIQKLVEELQ